jgi:hypothetical protein
MMIRANRATLTLLVALGLGLTWDLLFYDKALGISLPLFVFLLVGALFGIGRLEGQRPNWRGLWLLVPLFFFAIMVFIRANALLSYLNVVACLMLLGFTYHFYASGSVERLGLLGYPALLLQIGLDTLVRPAPVVSASVDLGAARVQSRRGLLPLVRGTALAVPVLAVFTLFLAAADPVFANYVADVFRLDYLSDLLEWIWRGAIVLAVAWAVVGSLAYAVNRRPEASVENTFGKLFGISRSFASLGFAEAAIVLISVNLLFLAFVWIQFTYLFGGQANVTIEGYTYAEYARRGFFELLGVAVLALLMILSLHELTRRETDRKELAFGGLISAMIALVLVILASAFQRLLLYEDAFGYTQLRLYSHVFMIWLGFAFIWFWMVSLLRTDRFALGAFLAALGFLITLNTVNPDSFIAERNLGRYRTTGKLDLAYLTTLSDDAVPTLVRFEGQLTDEDQWFLGDHLRRRLERLKSDGSWQSWPSFHLSRQRAHDLLVERQAD